MTPEEESIAANLRAAYWATVGQPDRKPWEEASPESRIAWVLVARLAKELWRPSE